MKPYRRNKDLLKRLMDYAVPETNPEFNKDMEDKEESLLPNDSDRVVEGDEEKYEPDYLDDQEQQEKNKNK